MSGKDLFEGMSYVDARFVDEAENKTLPKRVVSPWTHAAAMAACLCLILFGLYNLQPYLRGKTEGIATEGAADAMPEGTMQEQVDLESQINTPAEGPVVEVPSVILYVEDMTEHGFVGTVAALVDTDVLEIGMELNVAVAEGTRHITADASYSVSADCKTDYSGSYVRVQFIEYDRETGTIIVNMIQQTDAPEANP